MTINDIPEGLHSMQYARGICEDCCGFPATQGNLSLIADCITAISKKLRKDERISTFWLSRRIETAQQCGEKVTTHWLRNGDYWSVEKQSTQVDEWARWKTEAKEAEKTGKLATDADYEMMREKLRELFKTKAM